MSDYFAESHYFQIVEKYFLNFCIFHSVNYEHNTLLDLICNINVYHHILIYKNQQ